MWESAVRELISQAAEPLTITRPQETIIDMVTGSGAVVQLVLLLLLAFSVSSWAIIFTKRRQVRHAERESERFIARSTFSTPPRSVDISSPGAASRLARVMRTSSW